MIIRSEYVLDDYSIIKNIYEYFSYLHSLFKSDGENLENKFFYDDNYSMKVDDKLSNKYKKKKNFKSDSNREKNKQLLKDLNKNISSDNASKSYKNKISISNLNNFSKWLIRECFIIGINLFNNLVTFPSKISILCFFYKKIY